MYQVTCMHDRDIQCFGDCPGCIRAEINRLEELEEEIYRLEELEEEI